MNARIEGKEVFPSLNNEGYKHGNLFKKEYKAHRVVWLWWHGKWPKEIDHIDHIYSDNRINNLRDSSHIENLKNQSLSKNNSSGIVGVYKKKNNNKWLAQINADGKVMHLGSFDNIEEATSARKEAEKKYEFHENHGRMLN